MIDPTHTAVTWLVAREGLSTTRGRFVRIAGSVTLDAAARQGRVELQIDLRAVGTGVPAFDQRLRGADMFDVEREPAARFVGDTFTFDADGRPATVAGALTLRGRTAPVTLTAQRFRCYLSPLTRREVCGGEFSTRLRRSDWGLAAPASWGVPDEIPLEIQVEAVRQDDAAVGRP